MEAGPPGELRNFIMSRTVFRFPEAPLSGLPETVAFYLPSQHHSSFRSFMRIPGLNPFGFFVFYQENN